jgi:hypothetical protein
MKNLRILLIILISIAIACGKTDKPDIPTKKDEVLKKDTINYIGTTRYIHFYIFQGSVKRDTSFRQDTFKVIETIDSIFFKPEIFSNNKGFIKDKISNSYFINEQYSNGYTTYTLIAPDSLKNITYISLRNSMGKDQNDYIFLGKKAF